MEFQITDDLLNRVENGQASNKPKEAVRQPTVVTDEFGRQAIKTATLIIDRSEDGHKHDELLKASKLLGGYWAGGMLTYQDAEEALKAAIERKPNVDSLDSAYKDIRDGLNHGYNFPFTKEELEAQRQEYFERLKQESNNQSSGPEPVRSFGTPKEKNERTTSEVPLMTFSSMNEALQTAKDMPRMQRLIGTLLLKNTLSVWGGDNGIGKSILGFTVSEHLARGWKVLGLENECGPLRVLLCDFELTLQGLWKRYSDESAQKAYTFSSNVFRADFNPDFSAYGKNYDDQLFAAIRSLVVEIKADVLIIDNLTALKSQSNSDGDIALDLMNRLNRLKKELSVTIIALTHVTKLPSNVPIVKNHIAGSKHIQNLCDSIIGVAKSSQGHNKIYIKELKNRYEEEAYGADNILVCEKKKKGSFLTVELTDFDVESNHISPLDDTSEGSDNDQAKAIELRQSGLSIGKIAATLGKSKSVVHGWVKGVRSFEIPRERERTNDENEDFS